tara:strand:+ start:122 stop:628 length:507 start_codon:yes stop_codon:yes gene_type:complete
MKLILENWRKYLKEEKSIKVIMPPTDLQQARDLIINNFETDADYTSHEGEKMGTLEDWVKTIPDSVLPHEAIHVLQGREPNARWLFSGSVEGAGALPDDWSKATDKQKEKYFSVPAEIMAFAYDYAANVTSPDATPEDVYNDYEKIGGEAFEKFKKYVEAYKEKLDNK